MKKFWGWAFALWAFVGISTEFGHWRAHEQSDVGMGIFMICLFGAAGFALLRSAYSQPEAIAKPKALAVADTGPSAIALCAARLGGRVTVTDIASELNLEFADAKKQLEQLEKNDVCTTDTRDGSVHYDFAVSTSKATSARLKNRIGGPQ